MTTPTAWKGKSALVTGATSGLGLHLVEALSKQGANLILVARDATRLKETQENALALGAQSARTCSIDVTEHTSNELWDEAIPRSLDLLINAVGRSDRGKLEQLTRKDLEDLFATNVLSAWNTTCRCLPALRAGKGCIVNIGSLASKLAPAGLGGYAVSKFALSALSQQWRQELAPEGIHLLQVCPGPIQRDDAGVRYAELANQRGLDSSSLAPGGGAKVKAIDPKWLADQILAAAARRQCELVVPGKARWLAALCALWPSWGEGLLRKKMKQA